MPRRLLASSGRLSAKTLGSPGQLTDRGRLSQFGCLSFEDGQVDRLGAAALVLMGSAG